MNVVVLIDYENVYWSMKRQYATVLEPGKLIDSLRELAEKYGTVCLMQAYADFDNEEFHGLLSELQRRSVEPRHVFSKNYEDGTRKNAADIEMSLDALEMMYNREDVQVFILVCGDRDMIQVTRKLRGRGRSVYVVSVEKATSKDLIAFANGFVTVENLLGINPASAFGLEALVRRLHVLEMGMPFVGLKYFMRVLSGADHGDQRIYDLVNRAIAEEVIRTYQVPNPNDERFPTTACRLNTEHELVKKTLKLGGQDGAEAVGGRLEMTAGVRPEASAGARVEASMGVRTEAGTRSEAALGARGSQYRADHSDLGAQEPIESVAPASSVG